MTATLSNKNMFHQASSIPSLGLSAHEASLAIQRFAAAWRGVQDAYHVEVFECGQWLQLGSGNLHFYDAVEHFKHLTACGWENARIVIKLHDTRPIISNQ